MSERMLAPAKAQTQPASGLLQRAAITPVAHGTLQRCSNGVECPQCRASRLQKEGTLQRAAVNVAHTPAVPPIVHDVLGSPGLPLNADTRSFMEPRFGHDFSGVRVHTDARAAESANAVNALAYTVGRDVVFGAGQYMPESMTGKRLLAHELTHVVQQSFSGIQRVARAIDLGTSDATDASEQEASTTADEVMSTNDPDASTSTPPASAPPPTSAPITRASGCPKAPTGLGKQYPNPDCEPRSDAVIGETFLFCTDSDQIQDNEQPHLLSLIPFLGGLDSIEVHGYASPEGPKGHEDLYNFNLSCKRANSIVTILINNGIPQSKIKTFKHGGTSVFGSPAHNRAVVIPLSNKPITPDLNRTRLRVSAVSMLACAPCNPFTDDGLAALSPPAGESSISSFRMKHWMEAEIVSLDGIHIDASSPGIIDSGQIVGRSGFCGVETLANIINAVGPGSPIPSSSIHGEGFQWESEFVTQVGAIVPATLPDAPCGSLGNNPRIPPIRTRFFIRLFADGTKESGFVSASQFPFHYLYENGILKMFGGAPVQPGVDFSSWSTSTGVSELEAEVGFKALRTACCNKGLLPGCVIECVNQNSEIPSSLPGDQAQLLFYGCLGVGGALAASSCPGPCNGVRFGTSCSTLTRPPNP